MARGRMIDSSLIHNEKVAELPLEARWLLVGMISSADDQGRLKANAVLLGNTIFPYEEITGAQVESWLEAIEANGTIKLYTVDGKRYAQFINWWEYQSLQFAHPSNYPPPPGWQDRIRYSQGKGEGRILTFNWKKTDGSASDDTCDDKGKPTPVQTPVQTHVQTPVQTPTRTTKPNLTELNRTEPNTTTPTPPNEIDGGGGGGDMPSSVEIVSQTVTHNQAHGVSPSSATIQANAPPPVATPHPADALTKLGELLLENGFGEIRPATKPQVLSWLDAYQLATIAAAIRTSAANGKTSLNYVEGVLKGNGNARKQGSNAFAGAQFGAFGQGNGASHAASHAASQPSTQSISTGYGRLSDEEKRRLRAERKAENDRIRAEMAAADAATMH